MSGPWLAEELDILYRFYPSEGSPGVHRRTGRTIKAIQIKAQDLGLRITPEGLRRVNSACGSVLHSPPHRASKDTIRQFMRATGQPV